MKKYSIYFIYAIGFMILVYVSFRAYTYFQKIMSEFYTLYPGYLYYDLSLVPVGFYLGLPLLLKEAKSDGDWKIHFSKLLFFGIPLVILVLYPISIYSLHVLAIPSFHFNQFILSPAVTPISGLLLGYLVITSFKRV